MTFPRSLHLLLAALALGLTASLLPAAPAQAASQRVTPRFFGMTDSDPVSWPQARIGSMRLWDSGVTWRQIERRPGVFDFTTLDNQVNAAAANGARPLLVLGSTPRFHATRPAQAGLYGSGSASMPRLAPFRNYVTKLVRRYGARVDYQVWNESNVLGFWSGTPGQMATLTKIVSKIVAANAPRALVVSPALATRLTGQRKWLRDFYAQRTGGRRVAGWVDVVSLHLYPLPQQGPEASMALLSSVRTMLANLGVRKPIWNTEVNYGMVGGPQAGADANAISSSRQVGNVIRTYVLNAQNRVGRVYWYSWDLLKMGNTALVTDDRATLTPAGQSFATVQSWLVGTRPAGCSTNKVGTWTCRFITGSQTRTVIWNPKRTVTVTVPKGTRSLTSWTAATSGTRPGSRLAVGPVPVLLTGPR